MHSGIRNDRRHRAFVSLVVGLLAGALAYWSSAHLPVGQANDFDHLWYAARGVLAGRNPYHAAVAWGWPNPLYYPLPAVLCVVPLALLPLPWAMAAFAGAGAAAFVYVYTARGWWTLWFLLLPSFANAIVVGQWSVWLVALAGIPVLQGLYCLKPSIGLALWTMRPSWRVAIAGTVLMVASLAAWPTWPLDWLASLQSTQFHRSLVLVPGGAFLLLALLRWRRPEARFLAAMAVIPHALLLYEMLLMVVVVRSKREVQVLALLTAVAEGVSRITGAGLSGAEWYAAVRLPFLWLVYLPCLVMVLRRPNVAPEAEAEGQVIREPAAGSSVSPSTAWV